MRLRTIPRMPADTGPAGTLGHICQAVLNLAVAMAITVAGDWCSPEAAGADPGTGYLIHVPLPLSDSADVRVKRSINELLARAGGAHGKPTFILELSADEGNDGTGSEFERALSLARFLVELDVQRARTVAYVTGDLKGHAVLVALACEEIVMHPDASLGDAAAGQPALGPTIRHGYSEIASSRRTIPPPLALGLLDPKLEVYRVTTSEGVLFVLGDELESVRQKHSVRSVDTVIPAGQAGPVRGDILRQYGLVSHLVQDRNELTSALELVRLESDPSWGQGWRAIRVQLSGPVTAQSISRVRKIIDDQLARGGNFVCLEIDSPGGSARDSVQLADFLASIDEGRIRTVAFVRREARADAAVIAFACDHVVVTRDATIGGSGARDLKGTEVEDVKAAIRAIAERKSKSWSLVAAMIDGQLMVYRYTQEGTNLVDCFADEELQTRQDSEKWRKGSALTEPDQPLELTGMQAVEYRFARPPLVADLSELQSLYQLDEIPPVAESNWAYEVIEALASPQLAGLLLFVGAFAMFAELSSPGIGIGGFIAAICFVLYFWSNFLHGTAEALEILLFLTGLAFIGVEVFVLPGFGIFGLGGTALLIAALILARQTFVWPHNDYQLRQLPSSLAVFGAAIAGVITALVLLRKYLHRIPVVGRILLQPPSGVELEDLSRRESLVDFRHLLGVVGVTTTRLVPSGKARFDKQLVDVITDGQMVDKGQPVRVVDVAGNRVVVEPIDSGPLGS